MKNWKWKDPPLRKTSADTEGGENMATSKQMDVKQVVGMLEEWFAKLPPLPANIKEVIVKFAPWLSLIFGVLGILTSLGGVVALLGLGALGTAMIPLGGAAVVGASATGIVYMVFTLGSSVLELMAFSGLKAMKMSGWNLAFWSVAVSVAGSIVALSFVSAILSALIGFYLLFQVKSYYK